MKRKQKTKRAPVQATRYPVPGPVGGKLIRNLIAAVRASGLELPLTSHILCACSGGADSVALALLLARYGRRVGGAGQMTLIHVNHGWRGAESDADEKFVRAFGKRLGVPVRVKRLAEKPEKGESWEAHARGLRKAVFTFEAKRTQKAHGVPGLVFTAHQADDQAETRLWRLFTGAAASLGAGILPRHGAEIRPLLGIRRTDLIAFLGEERQAWREDLSNQDPRFLRARMRRDLMPVIESLFPGAIAAINSFNPVKAFIPGDSL